MGLASATVENMIKETDLCFDKVALESAVAS